jgi:hypothetical protein
LQFIAIGLFVGSLGVGWSEPIDIIGVYKCLKSLIIGEENQKIIGFRNYRGSLLKTGVGLVILRRLNCPWVMAPPGRKLNLMIFIYG